MSLYGNRAIAYVRDNKKELSKTFWAILVLRILTTTISLIMYLSIFCLNNENKIMYLIQALNIDVYKRQVEVWGTGTPLREFIYVDDMAAACVFLMENYDGEQHVNIGTGEEVSIRQLAETVKEVVGFEGELVFNTDMPDGTPRKLTTVDKLHGL